MQRAAGKKASKQSMKGGTPKKTSLTTKHTKSLTTRKQIGSTITPSAGLLAETSVLPSPSTLSSQSHHHHHHHQQKRSMAAQPAGRKAFQTTGLTQALAPNPNTSKSQFRVELLKAYNRDGYCLVKNVFSSDNIDTIHNDMVSIFRGKYPSVVGLSPTLSTLTDSEVLSGFSGIEHPLKVADSARSLVFGSPQISLSLKALIGRNIKCVSSDYWIQGPGEYGRAWGQDEETIMTRDMSLVMAFVALDDLGSSSGTILVHPASHKSGILFPPARSPYERENGSGSETSYNWQSLVKRKPHGSTTTPYYHNGDESDNASDTAGGYGSSAALASSTTATGTGASSSTSAPGGGDEIDSMTAVPIDMPAGSVLFVNGYTLQRMMPTMSESTHKRLLRVHFCSAETPVGWNTSAVESHLFSQHLDGLSYEELLDVRDMTMVAGSDPYEYKGTRNIFPVELVLRRGAPGM